MAAGAKQKMEVKGGVFERIMNNTQSRLIVSIRVDNTSYEDATERIIAAASSMRPAYVCVANVHMTMEAYDEQSFRQVVNQADLVVPDGMPLVWALRLMGVKNPSRVRGPDLTLFLAKAAAKAALPIAIYGGTPEVANSFAEVLKNRVPGLNVATVVSPPFRPLTESEEKALVDRIRDSGARLVFVGLGCPKQELWMARNVHKIGATLIGIGAAFDFHTGKVREAPKWLQSVGLEWLFRLTQEPRRLWRRYAKHNPRFVYLLARQMLGSRSRTA